MKILYICSTAMIIYTIKLTQPFKSTYDKAQDSFLHYTYAVFPCAVIALITHLFEHKFKIKPMELCWIFSIYLESISILPQLIVLQRYREVENLTGNYVFFMGAYRALYILNWIYRSYHEPFYQHHFVVYFCGVLQTLLYVDFFYYYIKRYVEHGFNNVKVCLIYRYLMIFFIVSFSNTTVRQRVQSSRCLQTLSKELQCQN